MYYYISDSSDPYYNQALEEYLFMLDSEEDIYILWQNKEAIVFGCYQNPYYEINFDFAWSNHVPIIRRISGGGTVYHDMGNINYTIIKTVDPETLDYHEVMHPLIEALQSLGYPVTHENSCDIYLGDKKISGNAQKMRKNRLLHHGTLLFDSDLQKLKMSVSKKQDCIEAKGIRSRPAKVGNLIEEKSGTCLDTSSFLSMLQSTWIPSDARRISIGPGVQKEIEQQADEKYRSLDWTFGNCPSHRYSNSFEWKNHSYSVEYTAKKGRIIEALIKRDNQHIEELSDALKDLFLCEKEVKSFARKYFTIDIAQEFI